MNKQVHAAGLHMRWSSGQVIQGMGKASDLRQRLVKRFNTEIA